MSSNRPSPEPDWRSLFPNSVEERRSRPTPEPERDALAPVHDLRPPPDHTLSDALELLADRVELLGAAMHEFAIELRRRQR